MPKDTPGKLKVFMSYAPGVGKIRVMLEEANRRRSRGADIVIGILEPNIHEKLQEAIGELEIIPPRRFTYGGVEGEELDLPRILERRPGYVLIDNLAHANAPGSGRENRYEDAEALLAQGINVLATMNIGHLESLNDIVADIVGERPASRVPDRILERADEVELVDLSPKALINRVARGDVLPAESVPDALAGPYRESVLNGLRELALREVAGRVDDDLIETRREERIVRPWQTSDRILLCVSPNRSSLRLIRRGWRIAQKIHGECRAVYVEEGRLSPHEERILQDDFTLCERLGIETETLSGEPGEAIVRYAQEHNVSQVILGHSDRTRMKEFLRGSLLFDLARALKTVDILVVANEAEPS